MAREDDYQFVSTDADELVAEMIAEYESLTGVTVKPGSPERLFISWCAAIIIQERELTNYTGNQNLPSRAEGENLDALAELYYLQERPEASPATVTMRFTISEPQESAILIPQGTRVTDSNNTLYWATDEDVYVEIGASTAEVHATCQTAGTEGNGYAIGQINTIVDVFDYYASCENITESGSGSDVPDDDEFYDLLRASQDAYSVAGPVGAYAYHAKAVSTEIGDVLPVSPTPGWVAIYVLMADGSIAGEEVKAAVLEACNADTVRPLTDYVTVEDPDVVQYDIDMTYYINRDGEMSASDVEDAMQAAIEEYTSWQSEVLGRDINPSELIRIAQSTGCKRVEVRSPEFTELNDGSNETVPQVAHVNNITLINGGYEYE
ncbi:MAG: baseplate J/gp47 family protein [Coriobacteriaceae bacterium]|nr:baseplate J/gp47 family protein [Coriobacteriaceae bacterium]